MSSRTWACFRESIYTISCFIWRCYLSSLLTEKASSTGTNITGGHCISMAILPSITERAASCKSTEACACASISRRARILIPTVRSFLAVVAFWTISRRACFESFAVLASRTVQTGGLQSLALIGAWLTWDLVIRAFRTLVTRFTRPCDT